jgi:hypothetical protein
MEYFIITKIQLHLEFSLILPVHMMPPSPTPQPALFIDRFHPFGQVAAVNLLIHQDYADHSRKAVIEFFRDGIQFWNPGDVFGDDRHLFQPGEKEVRNPGIASAMRRIIMCEQAGTGLRMIREQWKQLGHPEPKIKNDRGWKAFEFFLPGLEVDLGGASKLIGPLAGEVTKG